MLLTTYNGLLVGTEKRAVIPWGKKFSFCLIRLLRSVESFVDILFLYL